MASVSGQSAESRGQRANGCPLSDNSHYAVKDHPHYPDEPFHLCTSPPTPAQPRLRRTGLLITAIAREPLPPWSGLRAIRCETGGTQAAVIGKPDSLWGPSAEDRRDAP